MKTIRLVGALGIIAVLAGCAGQSSYLKNSRQLAVIDKAMVLSIEEPGGTDGVTPEKVVAKHVVSDDRMKYLYPVVIATGVDADVLVTGWQALNSVERAKERHVSQTSPAGGNRKRFTMPKVHRDEATRTNYYLLPKSVILTEDLGLIQFGRELARPWWHWAPPVFPFSLLVLEKPFQWAQFGGDTAPPAWEGVDLWANVVKEGPGIMAIGFYPEGELRTWHINSGHARGAPSIPEPEVQLTLSEFRAMIEPPAPLKPENPSPTAGGGANGQQADGAQQPAAQPGGDTDNPPAGPPAGGGANGQQAGGGGPPADAGLNAH